MGIVADKQIKDQVHIDLIQDTSICAFEKVMGIGMDVVLTYSQLC
jgi:hypothetical protein